MSDKLIDAICGKDDQEKWTQTTPLFDEYEARIIIKRIRAAGYAIASEDDYRPPEEQK